MVNQLFRLMASDSKFKKLMVICPIVYMGMSFFSSLKSIKYILTPRLKMFHFKHHFRLKVGYIHTWLLGTLKVESRNTMVAN
jgi:hypothetical protein